MTLYTVSKDNWGGETRLHCPLISAYTAKNESQSYRYLCNHRRAYKLFTDSISPKCKFTAFPCESYEKFESGSCFSCSSEAGDCGQLGYRSNMSPGRGSLYLLTREEEPFCGKYPLTRVTTILNYTVILSALHREQRVFGNQYKGEK